MHHRLVVQRHTAHAQTCVLPPRLGQQKALTERVQGPVLPTEVGKAGALHRRLNTRFAKGLLRLRHKAPPLLAALQGPLQELELLGRVVCPMGEPIVKSHAQRSGGHSPREGRAPGVRPSVEPGPGVVTGPVDRVVGGVEVG